MEILLESLKLGIAPSLIVAIYLTINKILDNKSKSKQIELNNNIAESFTKLNNFLDFFTKNIINREIDKCALGIEHSFDKVKLTLLEHANTVIINNNVDNNRDNIIDNLTHLINAEHYLLVNNLKLYSVHNTNIQEYISDNWKEEVFSDIKNIIFNKEFTKEQKIYILNSKLNNRINEYKNIIITIYLNAETNAVK